jgi:hypothetical protein
MSPAQTANMATITVAETSHASTLQNRVPPPRSRLTGCGPGPLP